MQRLGPLVPRAVRYGAVLLIAAGALFAVASLVPSTPYSAPPYTALAGAAAGGPAVNAVLLAFGALVVLGTLLIWGGFRARGSRTIGLFLIMLSAMAALVAGAVPYGSAQDVSDLHAKASTLFYLAGGFGFLFLSLAMLRDPRWDGLRLYSIASGLVTLVAYALFAYGWTGALGTTGLLTLAAAPVILWLVVAGANLVRFPTYSPPRASGKLA